MYREGGDASVLVVAFYGRVFGLNPSTGQQLWAYELGGGLGRGEVELVISEARVYACDGRTLMCVEYPSGRWLGSSPMPGSYKSRCSMVLQGDRLYVASGGEVTCFDQNGQVIWHQPFQGAGIGSVALGFPGNVRQADDAGSR